MKKRICLSLFFIALLLTLLTKIVAAALQCNGCHGTSNSSDYRPVDAAYRNTSTGGFPGNHRTHLDSSSPSAACSICHPGSSDFTASHRDGLIKVSSRVNASPLTTHYPLLNRTSAFPQTSDKSGTGPAPIGSCYNINCHFEAATPVWGSDPLLTNCGTCHGAPPSGTATTYIGGAAGSHGKHDQYYPGTTNCQKCHSNNTTFLHGTSAGKRALNISFAADPNNGSGSYSGTLSDYLPSQTNGIFGNCTATYCHSPGTKATATFAAPSQTATWGGTLGCGGCHASTPSTGSHVRHVETESGVPVACYKCHSATAAPGMTIFSIANHVNKLIDIAFNSSTTAIFGKYSGHITPMQKAPGSGYANCENVYCHSSGQGAGGSWPPVYSAPKWGVSTTGKCGTCHDDGYHGGVTKISSGSHGKHMIYGFASGPTGCGNCHYGAGFASKSCNQCHYGANTNLTALHINHKVDVSFLTNYGGAYSGTPEPGDGYGSCSNNYCHSDGKATPVTYFTPTWGNVASGACGTCHGVTSAAPPASTLHAKHVGSADPYRIACAVCHYGKVQTTANSTVTPTFTNLTSHVNKLRDVKFSTLNPFGNYSSASLSCNSVYCHSLGNSKIPAGRLPGAYVGNIYAKPKWSDTGSLTCNGCHGRSTPGSGVTYGMPDYANGKMGSLSSNSHPKHVQNSAIACVECHEKTTRNNSTIRNTFPSRHVDGTTHDVYFNLSGQNPGGTYDNTLRKCSNTYCHSPGTKAVGFTAPSQDAIWGGTLGCGGCHSATPTTGSHGTHINSDYSYGVPAACYKCHATTVTSGMTITPTGNHINRLVNVAFNSTTTAVFGKYSGHITPMQKNPGSGYANCENVYCHSNGQGAGGTWPPTYSTPKWGVSTTGKCGTCHADGYHSGGTKINSGSHDKHMNYGFAGSVTGCGICHYGSGFTSKSCTQCHYGPPNLTTLHINRKVDVSFLTKYGGGYNGTPEPGDGYNTCSNVYCHSSGTSVATGSIPANTSTAWGSGTIACSGCHGNPPSYANNSPKKNSHVAHAAYGCNKCHYRTTTNGTTITSTINHVNQAYDVYSGAGARFTYVYNAGGGTCSAISCHSAVYKTASWGSTACLVCHSISQGNRAAITSQFSGNSHHIQGTVSDAQCYQCHWEANSDGTINPSYHGGSIAPGSAVDLVVYGAIRPLSYSLTGTVTAVAYTANNTRGEIAKINTHCLGCHSDNDPVDPFGDGKTPKQYAWDGRSIDERYSQTGTTAWGKYTDTAATNITPKNTQTKAYSAHGKASLNSRGWNLSETWPNTSGSVNVLCYDCHNSHGSYVAGVTSNYSSATGKYKGAILKDTISGKGGYSVTYKPQGGGSVATKDAYNPGAGLCFDCHATQNSGTKPWGWSNTFGASQAIIGYWDTPYFTSGTFAPTQRYTYKASNAGNKGGHFGASLAMNTTPGAPINGLCTPCHDPHGVSKNISKISDQNYAVPLLKGSWMTSPYPEDAAPSSITEGRGGSSTEGDPLTVGSTPLYHIDQNTFAGGGTINWNFNDTTNRVTQWDTQFAGLCLQCHAKSSIGPGTNSTWMGMDRIHNTVRGWGTFGNNSGNAAHSFTCSKCHTPHNYRLKRLMVTNCLDYKHRGQGASGGAFGSGSQYVETLDPDGQGYGEGGGQGPSGGGGGGDRHANNTGPWFFTGRTCHNVDNAGGTGTADANQLWNTITPW